MTPCEIDDCTNRAVSRGLCSGHKYRRETYGDPLAHVPLGATSNRSLVGRSKPRAYKYSLRVADMTREELLWCAGLFEGEGTIYADAGGVARIEMWMVDRDVVERFVRYVDGDVERIAVRLPREDHHSEQYGVRYSGDQAIELAKALYPYMGARRQRQMIEAVSPTIAKILSAA